MSSPIRNIENSELYMLECEPEDGLWDSTLYKSTTRSLYGNVDIYYTHVRLLEINDNPASMVIPLNSYDFIHEKTPCPTISQHLSQTIQEMFKDKHLRVTCCQGMILNRYGQEIIFHDKSGKIYIPVGKWKN